MSSRNITEILKKVGKGDREAEARLIEVVYTDLHRIASRQLHGERKGHILQTTALVNEAYMRLFGAAKPIQLNDSLHFFAVAATQMRRILVDHARANRSKKRDGVMVDLEEACMVSPERGIDLVALDDALRELAEAEEEWARVVELRFFGGYTLDETAQILETNVMKVRNDWDFARPWLYERISRM